MTRSSPRSILVRCSITTGAQAWFGVTADLVTYGKIVGGGLPIGIAAGSARYLDGIDGGQWDYGDASAPRADTVFFAGTFNKNHLGMAAARAVLQHLKDRGAALQETLNERIARLADDLNRYLEAHAVPMCVAHFGSLFRFQFTQNLDPFFYSLAEKGIYVWEGRTCFLSTAHSDADIELIAATVKASIAELKSAGWFAATAERAGDTGIRVAGPRLSAPSDIAKTLRLSLGELRARNDLASYSQGMAALDGLAVQYVRQAFADLGHAWQTGAVHSTIEFADELGVVAEHHRLFGASTASR